MFVEEIWGYIFRLKTILNECLEVLLSFYIQKNSGVWVLSLSKSCQNEVHLFSSRKPLILCPFCPDKHFKSSLTFSDGHFEKIHIVKYKKLQNSLYT